MTDRAGEGTIRERLAALHRIVPSELDAEDLFRRNGEYVRLIDVLDVLDEAAAALPVAEPSTLQAKLRALMQSWRNDYADDMMADHVRNLCANELAALLALQPAPTERPEDTPRGIIGSLFE